MSTAVLDHTAIAATSQPGQDPFAADTKPAHQGVTPQPANGMYGFSSIQDFSGTLGNHNSDLSQTHGDALGFNAYLSKFYTQNFWFKDGGVKSWQYEEGTDNYQNLYGVDAVCVFYHSGHGNMDANGVFQAPMGGPWNNETWFFSNHNVKFANQNSRYIFWSTCLSCRIGGGNSPVKTWWADDNNPGFRMLFGFETTSVDSPDYGKNFWTHWNKGESFSTAWLNASWDIDHHQAPSCVASGTDNNDAASRVNTERLFSRAAVARNYYSWRWYFAATIAPRNKNLPKELKVAEFAPTAFGVDQLHELAAKLGLKGRASASVGGGQRLQSGEQVLSVSDGGHLDVKLAEANHENRTPLDMQKARRLADKHIAEHGLAAGQEYAFDKVRLTMNGGGDTRTKATTEPYASETTVQYRQIINGVPVVNSDAGLIRVTVDNDGTVTRLHSSVRKVTALTSYPKSMIADPGSQTTASAASSSAVVESGFAQQLGRYKNAEVLEEETGYDVAAPYGRLVTQRLYEVTFEHGLKKRIKLTVPRFE